MAIVTREFLVTWTGDDSDYTAPNARWTFTALHNGYLGEWNVAERLIPDGEMPDQRMEHDQFVSDCLKHIPVAFWTGKSREEIVLTYLSAVDDAMELIAENIAARITKEVKGT